MEVWRFSYCVKAAVALSASKLAIIMQWLDTKKQVRQPQRHTGEELDLNKCDLKNKSQW